MEREFKNQMNTLFLLLAVKSENVFTVLNKEIIEATSKYCFYHFMDTVFKVTIQLDQSCPPSLLDIILGD